MAPDDAEPAGAMGYPHDPMRTSIQGRSRHGRARLVTPRAALLVGTLIAATPAPRVPPPVPPLVFAARRPASGGAIPGFGPDSRALATGGRLMVLRPGASPRELLRPGRFFDVSHPSVSWDGQRVAFAATVAPDSAWRLWLVRADGESLHAVTHTPSGLEPGGGESRVDDLDPCWLPDDRIVFASTRYPQRAESGGGPVTNLFVTDAGGDGPRRITTERNGAEKPSIDPRDGRVVYARWWHARYLAADVPGGVTLDRAVALPADTIDLWQAVSVLPDGDALRLAGGQPRHREAQEAYAPVVLADGTLVAVAAERPALRSDPGATAIVAFADGFGARRKIAGAFASPGARAVAPAALPDGRIVLSESLGGARAGDPSADRESFRLVVCDPDGSHRVPLPSPSGCLALDATALVARPRPPRAPAALAERPRGRSPRTLAELLGDPHTFRFDCMNVFTQGGPDDALPDAPPLTPGARLRFFAALARPDAEGGDTLVMFREAPLTAYGAVHVEEVPADVPLFEQLVDSLGHPLRAGSGPAHTASFNYARSGSGTRCVGCHAGHSVLAVPRNGTSAAFVNAAPSARVTASDSLPGSHGPRAAADRRVRGPATEIGWVTGGVPGPWLRLEWRMPIEVREVVLYDFIGEATAPAGARLLSCHLDLLLGGRLVKRLDVHGPLSGGVRRVTLEPERVDALVVRDLRCTGGTMAHSPTGLAEIEVFARLSTP